MALDSVVYPQDSFSYGCKEFYTMGGGGTNGWGDEFSNLQEECKAFVGILDNNYMERGLQGNWDSSSSSAVMPSVKEWDPNSSPEACTCDLLGSPKMKAEPVATATGRRKRRRTRSGKNQEELENQRMTHIAVERNRRKQMNEYLAVIRSLMPASYVQRGDQASIIGGAINFVKELEQHLQTLEAQKRTNQHHNSQLFSDFFSFPQYSIRPTQCNNLLASENEPVAENRSALANIEVTMVESHANLKILSKKRPRQLLKLVTGFQCLRLTILHLNITTVDQMVLYTISVKLEDGCQLTTVDEIADAIHQLLGRIQEEAVVN